VQDRALEEGKGGHTLKAWCSAQRRGEWKSVTTVLESVPDWEGRVSRSVHHAVNVSRYEQVRLFEKFA
jgi:hypothetical protein